MVSKFRELVPALVPEFHPEIVFYPFRKTLHTTMSKSTLYTFSMCEWSRTMIARGPGSQ